MSTWVKVLNSMPQHPKILQAGDRAAWVYVCGLCYSNEHLTDGFIASHVLPVVAPGVKNPEALADRLVTADLWHEVEGGWRIHDYEEHQRSADGIREQRTRDAQRKAASRSNGSPANVHADSAPDSGKSPQGLRVVEVEERREEEKRPNPSVSLRATVRECFAYWQEVCGHPTSKLSADRASKIEARLREGYSAEQIRHAIDGAARAAFVNEQGKRFDDLELICRSGSKLESFIDRASAQSGGRVVQFASKTEQVVASRNRFIDRDVPGAAS